MSTEAIERAIKALSEITEAKREVLEERLNGIDRATKVLADGQSRIETKTPVDIVNEVRHLHDILDVELRVVQTEFSLVEQGFALRDAATRDARVAADTAIQAAFKAAQEISAVQTKASEVAAMKTENTFAVLLTKVDEKVDDLRTTVTAIVSSKAGATETVASQQQVTGSQRQNFGLVIAATGVAVALVLGVAGIVITLLLR